MSVIPHRWAARIDVFLLGDELLQDVVLDRAGDRPPVCALPFATTRYMAKIIGAAS
jgi:hypothetical protein